MSDHHINIFWSDEDGCYVADIPDLRFCSAFGETPEAALASVARAKQTWLDAARAAGKPEPRSLPQPAP
jgi:predicted RNase H-like HicB family nuclease